MLLVATVESVMTARAEVTASRVAAEMADLINICKFILYYTALLQKAHN
jgi:hypothetical protein